MIPRLQTILAALAVAIAPVTLAPAAAAHEFTKGPVTIDHPIVAPTTARRTTTAAFFTIKNRGPADRLVSAESPNAERIEIHTHRMVGDGVMRMERLADGAVVPAGADVAFTPGGLHLMVFGVRTPITTGAPFPIRLRFERAGVVDVVAMGEIPPRPGANVGHGAHHHHAP